MSTYSSSLRIELPSDGTQAGTWGDTTNSNLAYILDTSVAGYQTVSVTAASQALTYTNGPTSTAASNQAVYAMLRFTTTTGAAFAVYAPPASKAYIVWNNSGYSMTIYNSSVIGNTTAAGTGVTVTNNSKIMVWSDATNFYELQAANLTGTLAIANGGTGQVTANAALNALLPSQTSNANKYLQTDGTNSSWDAISLSTADITGTLAVANGGTGATDAATGNYNSYAPTLTGTGASGTWGINVTGNAATATSATSATALSTASGSAPSYSARAWVNFDGTGTVSIRSSGNVSSITDNGLALYTVNFTTAMPDANYSVVGMVSTDTVAITVMCIDGTNSVITAASAQIVVAQTTNGAGVDRSYNALAFFR